MGAPVANVGFCRAPTSGSRECRFFGSLHSPELNAVDLLSYEYRFVDLQMVPTMISTYVVCTSLRSKNLHSRKRNND